MEARPGTADEPLSLPKKSIVGVSLCAQPGLLSIAALAPSEARARERWIGSRDWVSLRPEGRRRSLAGSRDGMRGPAGAAGRGVVLDRARNPVITIRDQMGLRRFPARSRLDTVAILFAACPTLTLRKAAMTQQRDDGMAAEVSETVVPDEKGRRRARARVRKTIEALAAPTLTGVVLLIWQFGVGLIGLSEFVLPTPLEIAQRMVVDYRLLLSSALVTVSEIFAGFALAVIVGILTALAIFYSRLFERAVYPILVGLQTIPKVALAPLLVLYLGYDFAPKCFLAFLLAYFPIVIATVVGLQALDKSMVSLVRSMGASEAQIFFKLRLPAALPNVFGGFKVAISLAVIGAVIGEYVAAERGLGYLQLQASSQFDTTLSFAAVVVIALIGVVLFTALDIIERKAVFQREAAK